MTKILIFIDWYLPGYKAGGPISSIANLVEHLSGDIEFMIVTRDTDYCEVTPYKDVKPDEWNEAGRNVRVYYISAGRLSLRELIKITREISYDEVYVNGIYSLYFSLFPLIWFRRIKRKKVIVASRGMLSEHTFSSKRAKKKLFYFVARMTGLYRGVVFHATNAHEAGEIRKNIGFKGSISVAPNLPPKAHNDTVPPKKKAAGEVRLINIARVSPEKNILYALEVLEKLSLEKTGFENTEEGKVILDIFGTIYDLSYWKRCEEVINRMPCTVKINYRGPLEKSQIAGTLNGYHFFIMPSQGENYGHSIVESLMAGCPVIISDMTPWHNLGKAGWDVPLDQPQRFVEIFENCVGMVQEEYDVMSRAALELGVSISEDKEVVEASRRMFSL